MKDDIIVTRNNKKRAVYVSFGDGMAMSFHSTFEKGFCPSDVSKSTTTSFVWYKIHATRENDRCCCRQPLPCTHATFNYLRIFRQVLDFVNAQVFEKALHFEMWRENKHTKLVLCRRNKVRSSYPQTTRRCGWTSPWCDFFSHPRRPPDARFRVGGTKNLGEKIPDKIGYVLSLKLEIL